MSHENIRFKEPHFVYIDGYYYMFDHVLNILLQYNTNGSITQSYPINGDITEAEIISCEYDGFYFWTLQDVSGVFKIKKFNIEHFICYELLTFLLDASLNLNTQFDVECFTIESYKTSFATDLPAGNAYIPISKYYSDTEEGTVLNLGPNNAGQTETVTVTGTLGGNNLGLNFYTEFDYEIGDSISFSKNLLVFNNYRGLEQGGAIYRFNSLNLTYVDRLDIDDVYGVSACTFGVYKNNNYVFYIKQSNLRIVDSNFNIFKTANIDTVKTDDVSFFKVYDLHIAYPDIFRLQKGLNYFDVDINQTSYNFVASSLTPLLDAVSIGIYPAILPSNGINTTEVKLIATDQFSDPLVLAEVTFEDDDSVGFMTIYETYTDTNGAAISHYKSGTVPRTVTITAKVIQYS